jgi:hypothetical protein
MNRLSRAIAIVLALGIAGTIVLTQEWHGPIVLSLSATHGVDTGDLISIPFVLLAIAIARGRSGSARRAGTWALPASAVVLGAVLLLAGVLANEGGPLMPAGGATLDGTIRQTIARNAVPPGRWTNVALTYDGATERLYINGRVVLKHRAHGRIQSPGSPLWIGGNEPYGEHFEGLIDDVRVYARALSRSEIAAAMTTPVRPARGLVAGYAFDTGSGTRARDSSGAGNTGMITGAGWARGRFGDALRFDGTASVVRVPPSPSLDLTTGLTLSAWIRPSVVQAGWRAIVQRQADAYFLSASSGRHNRRGFEDTLRIALVVVAAALFSLTIATRRGPSLATRDHRWWLPVMLFVVGSLGDAARAPTGTLCGSGLVA